VWLAHHGAAQQDDGDDRKREARGDPDGATEQMPSSFAREGTSITVAMWARTTYCRNQDEAAANSCIPAL